MWAPFQCFRDDLQSMIKDRPNSLTISHIISCKGDSKMALRTKLVIIFFLNKIDPISDKDTVFIFNVNKLIQIVILKVLKNYNIKIKTYCSSIMSAKTYHHQSLHCNCTLPPYYSDMGHGSDSKGRYSFNYMNDIEPHCITNYCTVLVYSICVCALYIQCIEGKIQRE